MIMNKPSTIVKNLTNLRTHTDIHICISALIYFGRVHTVIIVCKLLTKSDSFEPSSHLHGNVQVQGKLTLLYGVLIM